MTETIYNVYIFGDKEKAHSIGLREYSASGTDDELMRLLKNKAEVDHVSAQRFPIGQQMTWMEFRLAQRLDAIEVPFKPIWNTIEGAVICITPVIEGVPKFDETVPIDPDDLFPDYLKIYWSDGKFDFGQLMDDDHLSAIKTLWKNQKYVSALKLLCSMIDTLGFIEYGPENDVFIRWIDDYCDMNQMTVSSEELWELRNSLLHMTNLNSRKVIAGKVSRLLPVVLDPKEEISVKLSDHKPFHVMRFLKDVLPYGLKRWGESYNRDRDKFATFVFRYDSITSEARMGHAQLTDPQVSWNF